MSALHNVKNVNDLELLMVQLSQEIERKCGYGPLSVRDAQQSAASLIGLRLLLNEFERLEVQERGASRELADRYLELEGRLKEITNDLGRVAK